MNNNTRIPEMTCKNISMILFKSMMNPELSNQEKKKCIG